VRRRIAALWRLASNIGRRHDFTLERTKRLHLTNQVTLFTAILSTVYLGVMLALGLLLPAAILAVAIANYLLVLHLNHRERYALATPLLLVSGNLHIASVAFLVGAKAGIHLFLVAAAMTPFLYYSMESIRLALSFAGLSLALYAGLEVSFHFLQPVIVLPERIAFISYVGTYVSNFLAVVFFTYYMFAESQRVEASLDHERARSERLLLNVLPVAIANRLKSGETHIADRYEEVTILFADIVGFTPLSKVLPARETVDILDQLFSYFDSMVERLGLEKIRTIGDGYFVAAGVPVGRTDHAQAAARLALALVDFVEHFSSPHLPQLQVRVGINTGPVLAGVIGQKKFQYDLWGDAVNIASRMESHGVPGKIQISETTYRLLQTEFACEPRGPIEVKGSGTINTWFLQGPRE
jgi:class 3 adenylate cyclase